MFTFRSRAKASAPNRKMIEEKTAKRINPARRERLNKGWPIKVYTYDCWPQEKPPQALWDTAHEMRRLWNDFTAIFRKILADDEKDEAGKPLLSKEERAILWAPINTKPLREIAKQRKEKLDAGCREAVVVRFLTTVGNWRKNPSRFGPPRFQHADEMNAISIPLVYNGGKSAEWLIGAKGTSSVRDTRALKTKAPEEYLNNGHFCVGITRERLNLHIAYGGRSGRKKYYLPAGCRIKQVSFCGKRDSAFSWTWSFQVKLEHPPGPARLPSGRVCGWDSGGWRLMGGYIRLGVMADNAGHFYELMVPLAIGAASRRLQREKEYCLKQGWEYSKPITFDDAEALDARYGATLEACKTQVRKIFEEEKENWPADAKKILSGIVKMRDKGLRRLRRKLEPIESEAKRTIDDWDAEAAKMNETIRAFEIHADNAKRDAYRQIAAWLKAFDIIAWEGDLSIKQMAEQAGKKKRKRKESHEETSQWDERTPEERQFEASQKYRQIVGQHRLRVFVKQMHESRLQNEKAAYSTQACPECGRTIESGRKLMLVCENGHARDQDVSAALHFLNKIEGVASITAPPVEIPAHLRPYLRVMGASEVRLELAEKR
jgi:hypothetical protein